MKAYPRLILRDFKRLYKKLIAIVIIVALGVAFLVGLLTTAPNMRHTIDQYYKTSNMADIVVQKITPFTEVEINTLLSAPEVQAGMPYFMIDEQIEFQDAHHMSRIVLLDFNSGILVNQLTVIEGRLPNGNGSNIEVIVEESQRYLLNIPLGFTTVIQGQTFEVVGIVNHPWYFAYVQEISPYTGRPIESMIYADQSFLTETTFTHVAITLNNSQNFNTFSVDYESFIDLNVDRLSQNFPDYIFTTRFQNQSFVKFGSDVQIVEVIAIIFPAFFFLITILVSMSSMTRIIHEQRIQIGTLRALGYSDRRIILKYILYVLLASGIGVMLGIALGIYSIPAIAYNAYVAAYNLPPLEIAYHYMYITLISVIMILSVVSVTYFSIKTVLKEKTSELLKHKAPRAGKKIFLEYLPFIWNRLKFKYKSTFRNIFRQKRNLFLMFIGIAGSTALLLAGFGIKDAVEISGDQQFNQMYQFNIELSIAPNQTNLNILVPYDTINLMIQTAQFENQDYINILIPEDAEALNSFLIFRDLSSKTTQFNSNSVFVTKQFAGLNNVSLGDEILLEFQGISSYFEVTQIIEFYFGNYIYVAPNLLNDDYDLYFNRSYVRTPNLDSGEFLNLVETLRLTDDIVQVQSKDDLMAFFNQTSASMDSVIILLVVFASLLAIIINYNLTLINISTRLKEMATLKVLGYHEKEVNGYIFRETFIISSFAILLGLIIGRSLQYFIVSQINVEGIILKNEIHLLSYIYTVLLSFLFLIVVYIASIPKIKNINMLEALKSFE